MPEAYKVWGGGGGVISSVLTGDSVKQMNLDSLWPNPVQNQ